MRPPGLLRRKYEWTWFYTAVEPLSGESFSLYLPNLDGACFEVFLHELAKAYPDDRILLFCDNAPAHLKADLQVPSTIILMHFPPYSPELNPVERFFLEFRRALANRLFDSVAQLHDALTEVLTPFTQDKERLRLLTEFPWWWYGLKQLECDIYGSG